MRNYAAIGTHAVVTPDSLSPKGTTIGALRFLAPRVAIEPWSVYAGVPVSLVARRARAVRENVISAVHRNVSQLGSPRGQIATVAEEMRRVPDVLPGQRSIARECAHLPNGSRVLSVGEGDGYYLIDLAQSFPHLRFFGFDIDLNKIRAAEQTRRDHGVANIWFFVADACEMAVKTKCFPFTHVRNVIHLVPDPDRCLRESARVTTEIVLFRDAPNWPFYRWLRFLQWATLKMRRRPNADIVLRGVRYATPLMTVKRNALEWARWMRGTDLFRDVRIVGHDLLWWDVDRPLGVLGLIGARVGFRCVVA